MRFRVDAFYGKSLLSRHRIEIESENGKGCSRFPSVAMRPVWGVRLEPIHGLKPMATISRRYAADGLKHSYLVDQL